MARRYVVSSGKTSIAASTTQVACQIATGSTITNTLIGLDISFDSTATGAGAVPFLIELVRPTSASSGGASYTPSKMDAANAVSISTARINDTSAGSTPLVLTSWDVSPTSGLFLQFPLGREFAMTVSDFLELKIITPSGITTCNYNAQLYFEE